MNNISPVDIMDAAADVGVNLTAGAAYIWMTEVMDLTDLEAWDFIWRWIYAKRDMMEAQEQEHEDRYWARVDAEQM